MVRPTANGPVGVGSVIWDSCSSQSDPKNTAIPRTPNIANTANTLNIRRASERGLLTDAVSISASRIQSTLHCEVHIFSCQGGPSTEHDGTEMAMAVGEQFSDWRLTTRVQVRCDA